MIAPNFMMKLSNERCLLDSNILVAVANPKSDQYQKALDFLASGPKQNISLVISSQNILETASVLTHGLKIPRQKVFKAMIDIFEDPSYSFIYPNALTVQNFFRLAGENANVHLVDLFLTATALAHNISIIITNDRDFEKIKGIKVYNPFV